MSNHNRVIFFNRPARVFFVLLAAIFLIPAAPAQPTAVNGADSRFLFIFSTSADMKKRVPAVRKALDQILATSMNGQLHSGDSIGIWTFDQDLHTGRFPLQHWDSAGAALIASNLTVFIGKQHYAKTSSFGVLSSSLNQLVQDSERLTVLIFCDGETEMNGTPFDAGVNQVFQQKQTVQKQDRQPFIIVLRSQRGGYVGCTVSFPPAPLNLPQFPPLPLPQPAPTPTIPAPAPPVIQTPSLIIIGTKVGTHLPPPTVATNAPIPAAIPETNTIPEPPKITSLITNTVLRTNIVTRTNNIIVMSESSSNDRSESLAVGATLLAVAGALMVLILRRARRTNRPSLITRSLNDRK